VDGAHRPIASATVLAMQEAKNRDSLFAGVDHWYFRPAAHALTGGNGDFELTGLMSTQYAIRASAAGTETIVRQVAAPGNTELVIRDPGSIAGRVAGVDPPPRIVVVANHASEEVSRRGVFSTGAFDLPDLPPGPYRVIARGEGVGGWVDVELGLAEHVRDVAILLRPSMGFSGRVVSARNGRGIADCNLHLDGEPDMIFLDTDADGAFAIDPAGPGPVTLHVSCAATEVFCGDTLDVFLPADRRLNLPPIVLPFAPGDDGDLDDLGLELRGNEISAVRAGSAAESAGLVAGDSIGAVDGFDVRGRPKVLRCLLSGRSGATLAVSLVRGVDVSLPIP
jgi:hypothetical protein